MRPHRLGNCLLNPAPARLGSRTNDRRILIFSSVGTSAVTIGCERSHLNSTGHLYCIYRIIRNYYGYTRARKVEERPRSRSPRPQRQDPTPHGGTSTEEATDRANLTAHPRNGFHRGTVDFPPHYGGQLFRGSDADAGAGSRLRNPGRGQAADEHQRNSHRICAAGLSYSGQRNCF